jgi:hypothetical protein
MIFDEAEKSIQKRIMGVWDTRVSKPALGCLLIFIEELKIQQFIHKAEHIDVCFLVDAEQIASGNKVQFKRNGPLSILDKEWCEQSLPLKTLFDIDNITFYYKCDSLASLQKFVSTSAYEYIVWPSKDGQVITDYDFDTTLGVQGFFKKYLFIPYLSCRSELTEWAMNFLQNYVSPRIPVVVHLKNNPGDRRCSNADFDAWIGFFEACSRYDVKFILIGNEEIDKRLYIFPNILIARDLESSLSRDLALIQGAAVFMGMASGLSLMALFSDIPYILYKNPDHHTDAMRRELGAEDQYPFATQMQKIFRVAETKENLLSNFDLLYNDVHRYYVDKKRRESGRLQ